MKYCNAAMQEDGAAIEELIESIKQNGLQTPILCIDEGNGTYSVVDGYRRIRAMHQLVGAQTPGWTINKLVPAGVVPLHEACDTADGPWVIMSRLERIERLSNDLRLDIVGNKASVGFCKAILTEIKAILTTAEIDVIDLECDTE
jgi:hypothetical protein